MAWIAAALIFAAAVFIAAGFGKSRKEITDRMGNRAISSSLIWKVNKKMALAILPLFLIIGGCITSVPAGHTGVLVTFGRVEPQVLAEGVNFKMPFQKVINIDNRVQKESFVLTAFSSDIQQTDVTGSINFTIDKTQSQNLYRNVGVEYYQTIIYPRILENIKLIFSGYTAEGLIDNRILLSGKISELMAGNMDKYGIQIIEMNIENIDFTDTFTDAVEAKQVAQQRKLTTQTEQEAQLIIAQTEAEKQVIAAKAEAEVAKIAAEAEAYSIEVQANAEADANNAIAASLTKDLMEYTKIQQWNGSVPGVQVGGDTTAYPVINIPAE